MGCERESVKKRLQVFFSPADEAALSRELVAAFPHLAFVDDNIWESPDPPVRVSISQCRANFVFLWNRAVVPVLPSRSRADGRVDGPTVGPVVQFVRSRVTGDLLLSGSLAASSSDPEMLGFVADLWRVLGRWGVKKVRSIDPRSGATILPSVPGYLLGPDAEASWSAAGGRRLRDRSTENYFAAAE
jgi:hypothetical protein